MYLDQDGPNFNLTLYSESNIGIGMTLALTEPNPGDMKVEPDYFAFENLGIDRFYLRLPAEDGEKIWGGGEQVIRDHFK